jgi:hypothetical protein
MADSSTPVMNTKTIYVFICTSTIIIFYLFNNYAWNIPYIGPGVVFLKWFFICLFVLWFNKYISGKIKQLFGLNLTGGMLSVTRTIDEPGVYNVFSDTITGLGNYFIYIVTLKFLESKTDE